MNRLSAQTKDSSWRAIKSLYDSNSTTICNTVLRDSIVASCISSTQVLHAIIPEVAAVIAALHFTVGKDVGAFIVENITKLFIKELDSINAVTSEVNGRSGLLNSVDNTYHSLVSNKKAINLLLLLIYLYNLRILHHTLIVNIMARLTHSGARAGGASAGAGGGAFDAKSSSANINTAATAATTTATATLNHIGESQIEMIVSIVDHCGFHLRADDPSSLAGIIGSVMSHAANVRTSTSQITAKFGEASGDSISGDMSGRMRFMLDALTDLKNNKSRRTQGPHKDLVTSLRKWLGSSVKGTTSSVAGSGGTILYIVYVSY